MKGMAARQELRILESGDETETNKLELTLAAAKRKAQKTSGAEAVKNLKEEKEKAAKADADARRAKMKASAAMFDKGGAVAPKARGCAVKVTPVGGPLPAPGDVDATKNPLTSRLIASYSAQGIARGI